MMRLFMLAALALPLAACAQQANTETRLGTREARDLARAIEGKVAGEPVSCVNAYRGSPDLHPIGDHILLYKVSKDLVYRNNLQGACNGLAQGDTLVLNRVTSQYCRGDIARVVNLQSGMQSGSCALGDFIPYRTPGTNGH